MMDQQTLKGLMSYDAATGIFRWKERVGGKASVGGFAGTTDHEGYTIIRFKGKGYKAHRLAWLYVYGEMPQNVIDHIDRVKSNNAISNLRDVTVMENAQNQGVTSRGASGVRGVSWFSQAGKWKATYQRYGVHYFVGHYSTIAEAAAALNTHKELGLK